MQLPASPPQSQAHSPYGNIFPAHVPEVDRRVLEPEADLVGCQQQERESLGHGLAQDHLMLICGTTQLERIFLFGSQRGDLVVLATRGRYMPSPLSSVPFRGAVRRRGASALEVLSDIKHVLREDSALA